MTLEILKPKKMDEQYFKDHFKVVGEHIEYATLYELDDHADSLNYKKDVIHNEEYDNNYWAIVVFDDYGDYDDTLYDNFESANEAWRKYDWLKRRLCEGADEPEYNSDFEERLGNTESRWQLAEDLDLALEDLANWTHNNLDDVPVIFRNTDLQETFAKYVSEYGRGGA